MPESAKFIDPLIASRIDGVEANCNGRHLRTNEAMLSNKALTVKNRENLISVSGIDGKNGRLGVVEETQDKIDVRLTAVERAVWKLIAGAASGGGAAAIVIELLKRV